MYTIFDEPYPSEINMQVTCAECEDPKQSQYAQGEWDQAGKNDNNLDENDYHK